MLLLFLICPRGSPQNEVLKDLGVCFFDFQQLLRCSCFLFCSCNCSLLIMLCIRASPQLVGALLRGVHCVYLLSEQPETELVSRSQMKSGFFKAIPFITFTFS